MMQQNCLYFSGGVASLPFYLPLSNPCRCETIQSEVKKMDTNHFWIRVCVCVCVSQGESKSVIYKTACVCIVGTAFFTENGV